MQICDPRFVAFLLPTLFFGACGEDKKSASAPKPSKVERISETNLNRVTLSMAAVTRLGIEAKPLRELSVPRRRVISGIVKNRPTSNIIVTAPLAGIIAAPARAEVQLPGARFGQGDVVLRLSPLVTPNQDLQLHSRRDYELAQTRAETAKRQAQRLKILGDEGAGNRSAWEEAEASAKMADAELLSAKRRMARLGGKNPLSSDVTLGLRAPFQSLLLAMHVAPGQTVVAGQPLFEIADHTQVWVEVPVLASALDEIDVEAAAHIESLKRGSKNAVLEASVVQLPAKGEPLGATMSLHYEVSTSGHALIPGQRVKASLRILGDGKERKVVPYSSILYDLHGNSWVYTQPAPLTFVRHRASVDFVEGELAILSDGPPVGTAVVTVGASEIFGTELGVGK